MNRAVRRLALMSVCSALFAVAVHAAGEDPGFMPRGGRTLLLAVARDAGELHAVAQARRSEAQWKEFAAARGSALSERERATLAAYLLVNMPMGAAATQAADLRTALPRDGRDLSWEQCQLCHSLFTSHLTQERTVQGWRNMFESPFHRNLKMTAQEREEFARYSALNMPMKIDDVPPDLRF